MIRNSISKFWIWYERHYSLNIGVASILFLWQLIHLYWLTTDVVLLRLTGQSFFHPNGFWRFALIFVDYTEIPAIITTSLVYINELRKDFTYKSILYLFFLNTQWLHIFWITDEFVVDQFSNTAKIVLPLWLSWTAICIDYLELPVIYDTLKRFIRQLMRVDNLVK